MQQASGDIEEASASGARILVTLLKFRERGVVELNL